MSLSLAQAKTLLAGVVGKGTTRYLGLSKTAPQPIASGTLPSTGAEFSNYNITEPAAATSYARIQVSATEFASDASGEYVGNTYITTISNTKEIHFTEAIQNWGFYKYFFITSNATTRTYPTDSVIYVGELVYDEYVTETSYDADDYTEAGETAKAAVFDGTATTETNFADRKNYLYILDGDNYVNCADKTWTEVESLDRYVAGLGIHIEANTVPLVRANLLKISVQ